MERLEAEHGSRDPFDESMVLLNYVVEIFRLDTLDDPSGILELENDVQLLKSGQIGTAFIDGNPIWNTITANGVLEEASRCCCIAPLG